MKLKRQVALLATTLTLSSAVQANVFKDLIDKFLNINKEEKTECQKMSNDEVAAQCVEEVCGSASNSPVLINRESVENYNSDETKKKLDLVEKMLQERKETLDRYTKFLEEKQNELKNLNDPSQINDDEAEEILTEIMWQLKDKHSLVQKVIPSKQVKDHKIKLVIPFNSPYSKIYKEVISKINVSKNIDFALKNGITIDEKTQYEEYLKKAAFLKEEVQKRNLDSKFDFDKKLEPNQARFYYNQLSAEATSLGIKLNPPVCDNECKKSLIKHIKKERFFNPQAITNKAKNLFDDEDSIAECRSTVAFSNVEAKNSLIIQNEWPKLIDRLKSNTSLKLSDHSKDLLLSKIDSSLNVYFNISPMLASKKFSEASVMESAMKGPSLSESFQLATDEKSFTAHAKTPRCNSAKEVAIINDHVLFKPADNKGDLVVSPFSCEHHHIGKEVMAHELGHAVSYFISFTPDMSVETKEGFTKLRSCSGKDKGTTWFPSLFPIHKSDKWTTEEDTADLFSFAVSEDKDNFMGCALALPNGEKYIGLDMKKSFFDTHSSGIQRLMVELQYKNPGKITEACEEVIKRSKAKINNKCF